MTDKEQIECKYKFQDKEKFDGKTYCTCFCELCEDLSLCDDNCQIYEDDKQLSHKTQECEQIKEKYEALKLENQEGYEIVAELKHEYEGLKKQLETSEEWRIKAESLNEKLELRNTCYHKALEEIEGYVRDNSDFDKSDTLNSKTGAYDILDIINKAKGEGICQ